MRFSKPIVRNGVISFIIEEESRGAAASFRFSNVHVKIDRTVPQSNDRPYQVVVSGTGVAANYWGAEAARIDYNYIPKFEVMGIGADWFNVVTPPDGGEGRWRMPRHAVQLTIGSTEVLVGNGPDFNVMNLDVAPYISPQSASTMVPLRFVAHAFGINDSQISWNDATKTATIVAGDRTLQFTRDSNLVKVNGVDYPMYSIDATPLPLPAEIVDIGNNLGRIMIPYRPLGELLGVEEISFDSDTQTAVYNPHLIRE